MRGEVFKFESFSTHDGDGIRGVVFLSGCPMRCVYCHNPESWGRGVLTDTDELIGRILPYKAYYKRGGGVTLSGGEPLLQGAFVSELTDKLHAEGLHVALDTSGGYTDEHTAQVVQKVDHIILDLKFGTEGEYRAYTGGSLETVLRFLDLCQDKRVWVRIVIVPTLNDTLEKLEPTIDVLKSRNIEKVELIPFHTMGFSKYQAIGIENRAAAIPAADRVEVEILQRRFLERLEAARAERAQKDKESVI